MKTLVIRISRGHIQVRDDKVPIISVPMNGANIDDVFHFLLGSMGDLCTQAVKGSGG